MKTVVPRKRLTLAWALSLCALAACSVGGLNTQVTSDGGTVVASDSGRETNDTPFDKAVAQERFATTTDIMRHVIAPTCAAEGNECHNNEDFPDLHTEGNLWNLVNLECNLGVGERDTIEDYCETIGDEIRITDGANAGYVATIGAIDTVIDDEGVFTHYAVYVQSLPSGGAQAGGAFELMRSGNPVAVLGGGGSAEYTAGEAFVRVTNANHIPDPSGIRQGDENRNGVYGTGGGLIVKPGDARGSYMVRRLFAQETNRMRMPLGGVVDNPNEVNPYLSANEMYALMSWINCMQEGDGATSPIRYDCTENASNEGSW